MFDRWEYTIAANTAEASAEKVECKITKGYLTDLIVYFPPGCVGLAKCRVLLGQKPVLPRTAANFVAADGMPVEAHNLWEEIDPNLPELNWQLWNEDETYSHTLWLAAQWLSPREMHQKRTTEAIEDLVAVFKRLVGLR